MLTVIAQYVLEVPRGFSVHVFKSPSPPAYPQSGAGKTDYIQSRPPPGNAPWKNSSPTYPSRPDPARKPSFGRGADFRGNQVLDYERILDNDRSKSQKPYGIYPGVVPDTYVYERSISSASDLPGSPSSSSSSDTEGDFAAQFSAEVSSIRASSSTETLEVTAFAAQNRDALSAVGPSPYGARTQNRPVIPPTTVIPPSSSSPIRNAPFETASDSDDGTVVDDIEISRSAAPGIPQPMMGMPVSVPAPIRRNPDERSTRPQAPRVAPSISRRESQSRSRSASPTGFGLLADGDPNLRLPPGLHFSAPSPHVSVGGSGMYRPPTAPPTMGAQRPLAAGPPEAALSRVVSNPEVSPNRRCVRWTEDLVCPSPVPSGQRRKGWFNRRGYVPSPNTHD